MKYVLIILLIGCTLNLKAQTVRAVEQVKPDSPFVFNRRYYELEDHWVVYPQFLNKYRPNLYKYLFGFVYFDEQLGYMFVPGGMFGIDSKGNAFRDPADYPKNELYKYHLVLISAMVSTIPNGILTQLNVKPIPDWVAAYNKEHPNKKTVAMKLRVGKLELFARDAAQYIGEQAEVYYSYNNCYKTEIRKSKKNSVLVLSYIGDGNNHTPEFIDIETYDIKDKGDARILKEIEAADGKPLKRIYNNAQQKDKDYYDSMVVGKIILFEGKPAIIPKEITILEPID